MSNKKALIVWGGWDGHQPKEVGELLAGLLQEANFDVEVSETLDRFKDIESLKELNLIVPIWTMGKIEKDQVNPLIRAVKEFGVGIAGCHGGMGDSFRMEVEYQFMVGGQWVAHPGNDGVLYTVHMEQPENPLVQGIEDFEVRSEKYYMHVDPAIDVLATTTFEGYGPGGSDVKMPVVWTKKYGAGKVYYCSLGHQANIVAMPQVLDLMKRGMVWAAR